MLSIIIPAYNEEETIQGSCQTIKDILEGEKISFEILFVDDGSKDLTWSRVEELHNIDERVKGISFSRNFGKESAIMAGLSECKGDCAVVIDCDLQHPPVKIVEMYRLWEQGYEIVEGIKTDRGRENPLHGLAAGCFYGLISKATGYDMRNTSDYKLLDRKAINALINIPEKNSFFRAMSSWVGFKTTTIEYEVQERSAGESKWSTRSLFRYAFTNITSFTTAPMQFVTILGVIMFIAGIIFSVITIVQKISGVALEGFTTVIILQCFSSSLIMICLGIIGVYISKIYDEVKGRPKYIVSKKL